MWSREFLNLVVGMNTELYIELESKEKDAVWGGCVESNVDKNMAKAKPTAAETAAKKAAKKAAPSQPHMVDGRDGG
ncbi:hypothetical protein B484DRAFT_407935, partial [Ochromonadaceae sp. CCMP2298]